VMEQDQWVQDPFPEGRFGRVDAVGRAAAARAADADLAAADAARVVAVAGLAAALAPDAQWAPELQPLEWDLQSETKNRQERI